MKTLKTLLMVIAGLVLIGGEGYLYASNGIKSKPGYAKLETLQDESHSALLSVDVGSGGVTPVRWLLEQMAENSDQVSDIHEQIFVNVLRELQGVRLRVYDTRENRDVFDSAIADTVASLKQKSWQTLLSVRDDDEQVIVLQYRDGEKIAGLSIMASAPDTALFLNLVGPFGAETVAEMASARH